MNLPRWMRPLRLIGAAAAAFVLFAGVSDARAPAPEQNVLRATLPNGLRVVIIRNTLAPVVATAVNYLAGGDETPKGFPGTAHAMEHMMFRGSPGLTADQLANIGSVMGGSFNANTRESLTQYLYTVPSEDLEIALHIEALRMQAVLATQEDWEKERGAIEQEVAQDLSNPAYLLYEKLRGALYAGTPYEHAALGTRPSFEVTKAADLKRFHDAWYAPNNAILVIAGDVEPNATLAKVKALFGGIKAKKLPKRPTFKFAAPKATSFTVDTDKPNATAIVAMRMPGLDSPDFAALEVLTDVLANHRFKLYDLVTSGNALDTDFSLDSLPHASIGYAELTYPEGGDAREAEAQLRRILGDVIKHGVPAELVEAAKIQERRATEFQKNGIEDLASVWSDAVALYGLHSPEEDLRRIEKVTVADVNRVARKYLDLDHAVTAVMTPQHSGAPTASNATFGGKEAITLGEAPDTQLPDWARSALGHLAVPPSTINPTVGTLPNGITLIVQPEDVSDTVSLYGHVRNRPETETPPGKDGVATLLEQLYAYGSESLDRLAFEKALDEIGASERAGADFQVHTLSTDFDRGVALLADNELHPALPEQQMHIIQGQLARVLTAREKSPAFLTSRSLRTALFPKDDPSLRDATPETVSGLTRADVIAYRDLVLRPDMTTIVVIGKITPEAARAVVEKYFGGWTATGAKPNVDLPVVAANAPGAIAVPDASRVQDSVILAHTLAINRADPDYYALQLGNSVLGGGFYSARLSIDLRKNAGLVYSVGSSFTIGRTRGTYAVQYASDPDKVIQAATLAVNDIKAMQSTPVSEAELSRSKMLLLRQIPLGEDSIADIARGILARRELDLPMDEPQRAAQKFIDLTPAEVQAAFKKWLRPDDLVRVTQGPAPQ
ncbi:MAG TPA: pitrilysin family protein [Rhizomicrobium sp.]|nr:pitrilysin family protein [Rhizomicrobium sp.]